VIDGWDKGLLGLCKGAHATLVVPPEFGYGDDGAGDDIPGGATLNFEVEVVAVGGEDEEHAPMDADQHDEPMDGGFEEPMDGEFEEGHEEPYDHEMDGEFEEGHEEPYDHESDPYDDPYKVG
jgi:FKBP-type peptidyl-prolyl cis-trans isomerase 2